MKTEVTIIGVIIMIFGALFAVTAFFPPITLDGKTYLTFLPVAGIIMLMIGFLTFLVGTAAPETVKPQQKPSQSVNQQPTENVKLVAICPRCKNRISTDAKFCPECGEDLRPTSS